MGGEKKNVERGGGWKMSVNFLAEVCERAALRLQPCAAAVAPPRPAPPRTAGTAVTNDGSCSGNVSRCEPFATRRHAPALTRGRADGVVFSRSRSNYHYFYRTATTTAPRGRRPGRSGYIETEK